MCILTTDSREPLKYEFQPIGPAYPDSQNWVNTNPKRRLSWVPNHGKTNYSLANGQMLENHVANDRQETQVESNQPTLVRCARNQQITVLNRFTPGAQAKRDVARLRFQQGNILRCKCNDKQVEPTWQP